MGELLIWWLAAFLLGLLALPVTFVTFKHLPGKGYSFSKALALILVGYATWLMGHVAFSRLTILAAILLLLVASGFVGWPQRAALKSFVLSRLGHVLVVEALFLGALLAAGAYKMRTPDLVGTEKPMDFVVLNGILASPRFPPQDPWYAGGKVCYYYFGHFTVAWMSRLTDTPSGIGYNLGVALIWALAATTAFGVSYALTRRYRYAWLSAAAASVLGNLDYWHRALQMFRVGDLRIPYYNHNAEPGVTAGMAAMTRFLFDPLRNGWDYFHASRIMTLLVTGPTGQPTREKLINEFPSFSFFLSDMHPHVMSIPFVLVAVGLAYNHLRSPLPGAQVFGETRIGQIATGFLTALVFGSLAFFNSWDFPTLMLLLGLCLALQQLWSDKEGRESFRWFRSLALVGLPVVAGAFVLFVPFYRTLQSQAHGVGFVKHRADLYELAITFGLFLVVLVPALAGRALGRRGPEPADPRQAAPAAHSTGGRGAKGAQAKTKRGKARARDTDKPDAAVVDADVTPLPLEGPRRILESAVAWRTGRPAALRRGLAGGALALCVLLSLGGLNLGVVTFCSLLALLALLSLAAPSDSKELAFATVLCVETFLLLAVCEVVYVKDLFDGSPFYRMNTVFKFHYQAWLLLTVASGPLLMWLLEKAWRRWKPWARGTWSAIAALVLLGSALYPVLAFEARAGSRAPGTLTLDGTDAFRRSNPTDAEAVDWIATHVRPAGGRAPVVLEAWGGSYSDYARLATNTGYPTVLGWDFHEAQWRGSWDKPALRGGPPEDTVLQRQRDVDAIYTTTDVPQARSLLEKYGVDYVYVGRLEREKYRHQPMGLAKFTQMGTVAFSSGSAKLYKLNP